MPVAGGWYDDWEPFGLREPPHPHGWSLGTWSYGSGQAVIVESGHWLCVEGKEGVKFLNTSKVTKTYVTAPPTHNSFNN